MFLDAIDRSIDAAVLKLKKDNLVLKEEIEKLNNTINTLYNDNNKSIGNILTFLVNNNDNDDDIIKLLESDEVKDISDIRKILNDNLPKHGKLFDTVIRKIIVNTMSAALKEIQNDWFRYWRII